MKELGNEFSDETKAFAEEYAEKMYKALGMITKRVVLFPEIESTGRVLEEESFSSEIEQTDAMEGHEFEYWCADLLKDNGFCKVSVTQGSGDQGVDILADKEGIRYAIQCKCFSNPLGNKPIQEVHAGKDIYRCHVGVVMTNSTFTPSAIEAAEHTNTLLWDRQTLERMLIARKKRNEEH